MYLFSLHRKYENYPKKFQQYLTSLQEPTTFSDRNYFLNTWKTWKSPHTSTNSTFHNFKKLIQSQTLAQIILSLNKNHPLPVPAVISITTRTFYIVNPLSQLFPFRTKKMGELFHTSHNSTFHTSKSYYIVKPSVLFPPHNENTKFTPYHYQF